MAPMGMAFKQRIQSASLRPFKSLSTILYDASNDNVWVADLGQATPILPVFKGATGALVGIVNMSAGWTSPGDGLNNGAQTLSFDGTYFYASQRAGPVTVVIHKDTLQVVGIISGYDVSNSVAASGRFFVGVGQTQFPPPAPFVNLAYASGTSAVASFPTPVGFAATNTNTHLWDGSFNGPWNSRAVGYNPSTGRLWTGSVNPIAAASPSADQQAIFQTDFNLALQATNVYTLSFVGSSGYTTFNSFTYASGSFGNTMISTLNESNPASPFDTLSGSTAHIYKDTSPFITLPTTGPYNHSIQAVNCFYDSYHDTILVALGGQPVFLRYNSSGSLVGTVGNPTASVYPFSTGTVTSSNIWNAVYSFSPGFTPQIQIYSSGVGSETLLTTLYGF